MSNANENVSMSIAEHVADEHLNDRALVAIFTGLDRRSDGNGIGYADAFARLPTLVARGLVKTEERSYGATPLVWLTSDGHEIIEDIGPDFDFHVSAIRDAR